MVRKIPQPRPCYGFGRQGSTGQQINGTWLECEEFCYPAGGMTRRAYAVCEDGVSRLIKCGIPDTYFSIPGRTKIAGKWVKGFVTSDEAGFKFIANSNQ